jgi:hypothetical protein
MAQSTSIGWSPIKNNFSPEKEIKRNDKRTLEMI